MSEGANELREVDWRRCCSFLEVLRTFRMAIHPAKLLLCFLGLAASFWIAVLLDQGFETDVTGPVPAAQIYADGRTSLYENLHAIGTAGLWGEWAFPYIDGKTWDDFFTFAMRPLSAGRDLLVLVLAYWQEEWVYALINTVVSLLIWAYVGGAAARMAAVRFAREETVPMKRALAFSCRKWPSLVMSPLIPFIALVFVGALLGVFSGLPMLIPYVGEVLIPVLFFLTFTVGLLMALILVGGVFSVGLQWPTIAAEGSDAFDAINRSVAYISSRPLRYLFYTVFAAVYGCLTFIFVKFVTFLTLRLTHEAVGLFSWGKLDRMWATPEWTDPWPQAGAEMIRAEPFGSVVILIFAWIIIGLMVAYLLSFCLSSQTIIYFLLRRSVDATDVEEVYLEESEEEELPIEEKAEAPEKAPEGEEEPPAEETGPTPEEGEGGEAETGEGEKTET